MRWDEEFDVICVGSGLGGLSAAITAAQRGARGYNSGIANTRGLLCGYLAAAHMTE